MRFEIMLQIFNFITLQKKCVYCHGHKKLVSIVI